MTPHDRATVEPFFQRPIAFWFVIVPMALIVVGLIGATAMKDHAARATRAESARRYDAQVQAIDEARDRSLEQEQARRSASMQ